MKIPIPSGAIINGVQVLKEVPKSGNNRRCIFLCPFCNNQFTTQLWNIKSGHTKSCGCKTNDFVSSATTKHGDTINGIRSAEFKAWSKMIQRCHNVKAPEFKNYGKRGIIVCEEWRKSFAIFLSHVGRKPSNSHSIDRINNDGNYEPGNCRWATRQEQSLNKRGTLLVTHRGVIIPLLKACAEIGIKYDNVRARKTQRKISVQDAFEIYSSK